MTAKHILNRASYILKRNVNNIRLVALVGLLMGAVAAPTHAGYREGAAALAQGKHARAIREFKESAEQGNLKAMIRLGEIYRKGEGAPQDFAAAVMWYERAAAQGNAWGQSKLGQMYGRGEGVERDIAEAARLFRLAAEQGFLGAQVRLGELYRRGEGVPQDFAEAVMWYERAAAQGNAWGQTKLGEMYGRGDGVERDVAEAVKLFHMAADQGFRGAQARLGEIYRSGEGVERDPAVAADWYRLAAEQGHIVAQIQLGEMYWLGEGVPQDLDQAEALFRTAAEKGNEEAQIRVAALENTPAVALIEPAAGEPATGEPDSEDTVSPPPTVTEQLPEEVSPPEEAEITPSQINASVDDGYQVQLASYRVPGRARQAWERLRDGHKDLLGDLKPSVYRVDLGPEIGVFFRLVAGPVPSESAAQVLCSRLKAEDVDCLVWQK